MKSFGKLAVVGALGAMASVGLAAGPANADVAEQGAYISNDSRCDKATGQWIAIYNVQNLGTLNAMFTATSPTSPITWPTGSQTAPGQVSTAEQRLPAGSGYTTLTVTGIWSDGTLKTYSWQYRNPTQCTKG
ncbi:hypothetical protein AB0J80_09870 [Actinoplanes sp. NPDC049548]|uniref:hypothetical protein n=1 Tax=Actinoplanes sp. NPDC049548 TaxID=3155152 RepID=UPI0034238C62